MVRLLRTVNKKARWDKTDSGYSWLKVGESPADILRDFISTTGIISVWRIENEEEINKILTGLAISKGTGEAIEYILWDERVVIDHSFTMVANEGTTVYTEINKLHRDLTGLTALKTAELVNLIWPSFTAHRIDEAGVEEQIRNICNADWFQLQIKNVKNAGMKNKIIEYQRQEKARSQE